MTIRRFLASIIVGASLCLIGYQSTFAQGMGIGNHLGYLSAFAQRMGIGNPLAHRVTELEAQIADLQALVASLQPQPANLENLDNYARVEQIADLQALVASLQPDNLKNLGNYVRVDESGPTPVVWFEAVNVKIVNGTGFTGSTLGAPAILNGLGNLIVGYDEPRDPAEGAGESDKTGSHNLIVGPDHNYSSYGGFVAGAINTVSAPNASVSGGGFNTASGDVASVSGGVLNVASGVGSSVSGGVSNIAAEGDGIDGETGLKLVHVVPHIEQEASGPSYSVGEPTILFAL